MTALVFYIYLSPRAIPAKYLIPGTLFLIVFQIVPVLYTVSTAFTNFGDAHRGSKQEAIAAIEGASVQAGARFAGLHADAGHRGGPATGDIVFLLTDPADQAVVRRHRGRAGGAGRRRHPAGPDGKITARRGYTVLNIGQASARTEDIPRSACRPTRAPSRARACPGPSRAARSRPTTRAATASRTPTTGQTWTADDSNGLFVNAEGEALAQGWKVNVGFRNFADVLTDQTIRASFLQIVVWNFAFAIGVVGLTFVLGLLVAIV